MAYIKLQNLPNGSDDSKAAFTVGFVLFFKCVGFSSRTIISFYSKRWFQFVEKWHVFCNHISSLTVDFSLQLDVPKELISESLLKDLRAQKSPSFVPILKEGNLTKIFDNETGITQCHLSNGIPVNYKVVFPLKCFVIVILMLYLLVCA